MLTHAIFESFPIERDPRPGSVETRINHPCSWSWSSMHDDEHSLGALYSELGNRWRGSRSRANRSWSTPRRVFHVARYFCWLCDRNARCRGEWADRSPSELSSERGRPEIAAGCDIGHQCWDRSIGRERT